jgi:hypothetical protein
MPYTAGICGRLTLGTLDFCAPEFSPAGAGFASDDFAFRFGSSILYLHHLKAFLRDLF